MNNKVVLDASALLALIQNEKGADVIRPLLKRAVMSAINVAEVLTALQRVEIQPKEAILSIRDIIQELVPFDVEQANALLNYNPTCAIKAYLLATGLALPLGENCKRLFILPIKYGVNYNSTVSQSKQSDNAS